MSFIRFFDMDGNFKADKFSEELKANNIAEVSDGYKLGFVGKDYARLQAGRTAETMIVPDCKHNNLPENRDSGNIFIIGDNLEALRHLRNAYENRIKLIYIDQKVYCLILLSFAKLNPNKQTTVQHLTYRV
ncbi:hypothetical protein AGMMS50229_19680 [Campylobacterota bacterium]|nr:hypothetical protein AGMMS50229_19680 [Campylobacterota bacterium]